MSNVVDKETGKQLADGAVSHVLEWGGRRVGLIGMHDNIVTCRDNMMWLLGMVEQEWLDTLATINTDQVDYEDYVVAANKLAAQLREKDGCEVVIALTHMRTPNDIRLAENVEGVDLILGGHDHVYEALKVRFPLYYQLYDKPTFNVRSTTDTS